ncbi:MAG TPA: pilus assembly protein TadG-related protein [Xanthobacteraceae bacterium]|nr:pilus assembly protein TadG-related protein [Xanthobacteraceae bacterium]
MPKPSNPSHRASTCALVLARQIARATAGFFSDRRGNVAVTVAVSALPILYAIGCVIDFSLASMVKTKIQAAADAATLATVSNNSPTVANAKAGQSVSGGSTYATNFFDAGSTSTKSAFNLSLTRSATVTMSGTTVTAALTYSGSVPTYFLGLIGYKHIPISGSSTSSFTLNPYIDFYMMLDTSGSMGMPSTAAEQARLQAVNPDNQCNYNSGCTFACHFTAQGACSQSCQGPYPAVGTFWNPSPTNPSPGGYCQGFIISRLGTSQTTYASGNNSVNGNTVNWNGTQATSCPSPGTTSCIQLRLDAVGYAVSHLLQTASTTETQSGISNQFRVGLFPFIQNLCYASAGNSNSCSVGLTTSLTGTTITNMANGLANFLDTGQNSTLGSGGTHFENALNTINTSVIANPAGTGTAANPLPYLFIITDGSQDYQTQWNGGWSSQNWTSNSTVPHQNSATYIPPNSVTSTDYCTTMKNRGVTIAVLYIPYQYIANANASFASNEDGYANGNVSPTDLLAPALQACASPNFFYTASTPAAIDSALQAMFKQAVNTAHISQ